MKNDNKRTDITDETNQLGMKYDDPSLDETINNAEVAWTPGSDIPMIANIHTKSGITSSLPPIKQKAIVRRPLFDGKSGPSTF